MTSNSEEDEIRLCKARMKEIAVTRPGTLELVREYADLQNRVMAIELRLAASHGHERAYRLRDFDTRWDLRTDAVRVYLDASVNRRTWVVFRYAVSVRDPLGLSCVMRFDDVSCSRTTRIDLTEVDKYVIGILGVDGLGIFDVIDSHWLGASRVSSDLGLHHYCLVFSNVVIEFLARHYRCVSSHEDLDALGSELFRMR